MTGPVRRVAAGAASQPAGQAPPVSVPRLPTHYGPDPMKTRTLVVLALLCGLALLIAFTVQVLQAR